MWSIEICTKESKFTYPFVTKFPIFEDEEEWDLLRLHILKITKHFIDIISQIFSEIFSHMKSIRFSKFELVIDLLHFEEVNERPPQFETPQVSR
jgi:hypothetical protein